MNYRVKFTFFDEYWTDFRRGTVRRFYEPKLYSLGPNGAYASLVYNKEKGVYQLFYEVVTDSAKDDVRFLKMSESKDLITFTPVLNENGSDILFIGGSGVHGCSVMLDENETDRNKKYKLCGMLDMGDREDGKHSNNCRVTVSYSPDGIHWTADREHTVHPQTSDTLNKLFYNPVFEEYGVFMRSAYVDRRISLKTSKDLINWSQPELILQPSSNYNDGFSQIQFYAMSAKYFDGIFYGLVWRYNTNIYNMEYSKMFGFMEPELYYSYDGRHFLPAGGKVLMPRPDAPFPGCLGLSPNDICESEDKQSYFILCTGNVFCHGTFESNELLSKLAAKKQIKRGTPIYKIRKDGFCGLESVGAGGEVVTKPIALKSADIILNVNAACGYVRYGIRKKNGDFLEGFSYEDCEPVEFSDEVSFKAKWRRAVNEILGKQVRISVELNSAVIYSITADAVPYIAQKQKSFADPQADI